MIIFFCAPRNTRNYGDKDTDSEHFRASVLIAVAQIAQKAIN